MKSAAPCILTLNAGSSSIRFALFESGANPHRRLAGKIEGVGSTKQTKLSATNAAGKVVISRGPPENDYRKAANFLLDWLEAQGNFSSVRAVGHRVVHGMKHSAPERITPRLLTELRRITAYDPEHLPRAIGLIAAVSRRCPHLPQVACFDTAFHRAMPAIAKLLPIPRRYRAKGVERYGFHGLSYAYLMEELTRISPAAAKGRIILAHLGNGASLAAVHRSRCIDTSMGFTPASGLMMGTRSGDLDPGLLSFLARTEQMTPARFQRMVNQHSGLLGVSGSTADLRVLLARESTDTRAAEAVALFCYQAKKWIGAFAAVLGGLDTLVFAGGIGENSPLVRARICAGLGFLGLDLRPVLNHKTAPVISRPTSRVQVRVIRTDEEQMIARSTRRVLGWDD